MRDQGHIVHHPFEIELNNHNTKKTLRKIKRLLTKESKTILKLFLEAIL